MVNLISLKQFNNARVLPLDDANIYNFLTQTSGILRGVVPTLTGTNQLNVSGGYGFASGRLFSVEEESIAASLVASGTQKGRLYIHIDLTNQTNPAQLLTVAAATLPALVQDDLSAGGSIFDIPLAEYTVTATAISDFRNVTPVCVVAGSRENLLINSNFLMPVNQRGETAYSTADQYTVDRWRLGASSTANVNSTGLTVTGTIIQPIEQLASMKGQTFTLSGKQAGGQVQAVSGVLGDTAVASAYGYTMSFSVSGEHVLVTLGAGTWEYVKFELGARPSAYAPSGYGDELTKAQRYYVRFGFGNPQVSGNTYLPMFDGSVVGTSAADIYVYFPVAMRALPSIPSHNGFLLQAAKSNTLQDRAISSLELRYMTQSTAVIRVNTTETGLDIAKVARLYSYENECHIDFDAEIY